MIRWDEILFVLFVWGIVLSPALLALIWAWFTRIPLVRKILIRAFIVVLATPFLSAGLFALLTRLCARGHIDQQFAECGPVPDSLANLLLLAPLLLLVPPSAIAALYCAFLEIRRFRRSE